mmetsp:Transcript_1772/g.3029  ORF Transcript_1772/g.3029 Transcript_1772/m.3029 type:complete len:337 (+) Transcript_1772:1622-2632(+)
MFCGCSIFGTICVTIPVGAPAAVIAPPPPGTTAFVGPTVLDCVVGGDTPVTVVLLATAVEGKMDAPTPPDALLLRLPVLPLFMPRPGEGDVVAADTTTPPPPAPPPPTATTPPTPPTVAVAEAAPPDPAAPPGTPPLTTAGARGLSPLLRMALGLFPSKVLPVDAEPVPSTVAPAVVTAALDPVAATVVVAVDAVVAVTSTVGTAPAPAGDTYNCSSAFVVWSREAAVATSAPPATATAAPPPPPALPAEPVLVRLMVLVDGLISDLVEETTAATLAAALSSATISLFPLPPPDEVVPVTGTAAVPASSPLPPSGAASGSNTRLEYTAEGVEGKSA